MSLPPSPPTPPRSRTLLGPALGWSLLHVPLLLALYADSIAAALRATPPSYRVAYAPAFLVQASVVALVAWAIGLPLARWSRVYRRAAPAIVGLATIVAAIDARALATAGFHLN
ncbi:MAG TPA: hypothetical protein VD838_08995, partial [Anaeromyxobacteraceae bacterium]|nr:hypothetical protein [Anaeromyxobacteraceae bacterium]